MYKQLIKFLFYFRSLMLLLLDLVNKQSVLQVGLDITTRSVPIQMVTISRMSLYRELTYI